MNPDFPAIHAGNKNTMAIIWLSLGSAFLCLGSTYKKKENNKTNLVAFSLKIANNTPIITNGITKIIHDQNPIFIIHTSS